jgi:hypothetical protein
MQGASHVFQCCLAALVLLSGCQRAKRGAKDALNAGGELAGTAATEVIEGVATGVEETWKVDVRLSAGLLQQGLALGKTSVESDASGRANTLVLYITTTDAVHDTLHVFAVDKDSLEMGRALLPIDAAPGSGNFYEVHFPDRTDLERKSVVRIR